MLGSVALQIVVSSVNTVGDVTQLATFRLTHSRVSCQTSTGFVISFSVGAAVNSVRWVFALTVTGQQKCNSVALGFELAIEMSARSLRVLA